VDTIAELFSRNLIEQPYTRDELDEIIKYMRERRAQFISGKKTKGEPAKPLSLEDLGL